MDSITQSFISGMNIDQQRKQQAIAEQQARMAMAMQLMQLKKMLSVHPLDKPISTPMGGITTYRDPVSGELKTIQGPPKSGTAAFTLGNKRYLPNPKTPGGFDIVEGPAKTETTSGPAAFTLGNKRYLPNPKTPGGFDIVEGPAPPAAFTLGDKRYLPNPNAPQGFDIIEGQAAGEQVPKSLEQLLTKEVQEGRMTLMDALKAKEGQKDPNKTEYQIVRDSLRESLNREPTATEIAQQIEQNKVATQKAGKAEVNVTTKVGADSMTKLGEEMSKALVAERKDVIGAVASLNNIKEAEKLINSGVITGTGAEFLVNLGNFLSSRLGIRFAADPVANSQAYVAMKGNEVGQIIKQFGAGTGLSDADREYAEKIVGGKITLTEAALKKIIEINKRAHQNVIANFNKKAEQAMKKPGAESLPYDLRIEYKFDEEQSNRPPLSSFKK